MNKEIYSTKNFIVFAKQLLPHISREEGGHIFIDPKIPVGDRTQLSPSLAIELMRLTMVVGEAMVSGLARRGIEIGRINYQDNGNWDVFKPEGPRMHVHLYGRAKTATIQKYGEATHFPMPSTGFYDTFQPLDDGDIQEIKLDIEKLFLTEKYQDADWHL